MSVRHLISHQNKIKHKVFYRGSEDGYVQHDEAANFAVQSDADLSDAHLQGFAEAIAHLTISASLAA